jgi:hypothetical protein
MRCVNGGVYRGKVISDFHLKVILEKKSHQALLHYIWKLHETINYSVIETKLVIINFINEMVVILEGLLQRNKKC